MVEEFDGCTLYQNFSYHTVKIKCAYHTNGVLYGTVRVLIALIKV